MTNLTLNTVNGNSTDESEFYVGQCNKGKWKVFLKITRISLVVFAILLVGGYVMSILDPMLGLSGEQTFPTRAQAAVDGLHLLVYAILILVPPCWLIWSPAYYCIFIGRIVGLIVALVAVGGILRDQGTTFASFLFISLCLGLLVILPTGLAVWEIVICRGK
jgi:hypothetical protein